MKDVKGVSFKLEDQIVEKIEEVYPSLNFAATRITRVLPFLRRAILETLKGKFLEKELKYILDMRNATLFEAHMSLNPQYLIMEIEDSDKYEGLGQKWDVVVKGLCDKIAQLAVGEIYFLTDWLDMFWRGGKLTRSDEEFQKYIQQLV